MDQSVGEVKILRKWSNNKEFGMLSVVLDSENYKEKLL